MSIHVMGKISPDKVQLNAVVGLEIDRVVAARARALGLTKSKFAALVFEQWEFDGYPAFHRKINAADSTMFNEVMKAVADEKSLEGNAGKPQRRDLLKAAGFRTDSALAGAKREAEAAKEKTKRKSA